MSTGVTDEWTKALRKGVVEIVLLAINSAPQERRQSLMAEIVQLFANTLIQKAPGLSIEDMRKVFVHDFGSGTLGDEVRKAWAALPPPANA